MSFNKKNNGEILFRLYSPGPCPCVGHVVSYVAASGCQSVARDSAVRSEQCTVGQRQDISDTAVHEGKLGSDNIRNTVSVCCDKTVTTQQNMLLKMKVNSSAMHLLYILIVVIVAN